jgi:hypothetical protein
MQHAFEPGDLCVEVGYLRLAYQASHDSLLRSGRGTLRQRAESGKQRIFRTAVVMDSGFLPSAGPGMTGA